MLLERFLLPVPVYICYQFLPRRLTARYSVLSVFFFSTPLFRCLHHTYNPLLVHLTPHPSQPWTRISQSWAPPL